MGIVVIMLVAARVAALVLVCSFVVVWDCMLSCWGWCVGLFVLLLGGLVLI